MQIIRKMPLQLVTLLVIFFLMPFASISFLGAPWEYSEHMPQGYAIGVMLAYWILPLGICLGFALRQFFVLPLLLLECLLLIWHTVLNLEDQPFAWQLVRLGVLATMAALGFVTINKDVIFPLMSRNTRYWRRNARYPSSQLVHVMDAVGNSLPMNMQDCSLTGMGLSASHRQSQAFFTDKNAGERFRLTIKMGQATHQLEAEIAWKRQAGPNLHLGVRIQQRQLMAELLKTLVLPLGLQVPTTRLTLVDRLWDNVVVKRTAMALWSLSILVSFGMPACSHGDKTGLAAKDLPIRATSVPADDKAPAANSQ